VAAYLHAEHDIAARVGHTRLELLSRGIISPGVHAAPVVGEPVCLVLLALIAPVATTGVARDGALLKRCENLSGGLAWDGSSGCLKGREGSGEESENAELHVGKI